MPIQTCIVLLRSFDDFSETAAGLPYSLWALSDASGWLGWVAWLVRLWGIQETRSLHLEISRFATRVYVGPPLAGRRSLVAGGRVPTFWSLSRYSDCAIGCCHSFGTCINYIGG